MGMVSEFKEFAMKGSVVDLAVGVIIGGAFGKIIDSFIGDIVMPVISVITGGKTDFTQMFIPLAGQTATTLEEARKAGAVLAWGNFVTILIGFIILALVVFMMIKAMNSAKRKEAAAPAAPAPTPTPEDVVLLREIRDALKK